MKKVNITIQYDEEKLETMKVYLNAKDLNINDELVKTLDKLYVRVVPANVRDFFDKKAGMVSQTIQKPSNQHKKPQQATDAKN